MSGDLFEVDFSFGMDFTEDHTNGVLDRAFTSNFGVGILSEAGIKDRVGNVITEFIRMTTGNIFRGEEEVTRLDLRNHG